MTTTAPTAHLITILGATGGTGQLLVEQALARGYRVRAAVRSPDKLSTREGLEIVKVDIFDAASLSQPFAGATAVVSALGGVPGFARQEVMTRSIRTVVEAMRIAGVSRLVVCSSQCTVYSKEHPFFFEWVVKTLFLSAAMDDLHRMEEFLETEAGEGIVYTVVKPPRLVDGPATGRRQAREGQYIPDIYKGMTRADLAAFMLDCLEDETWTNKLVAISA